MSPLVAVVEAEEAALIIMQVAAVAKVLTQHIHIVDLIITPVIHTIKHVCRPDVKKSWITADEELLNN